MSGEALPDLGNDRYEVVKVLGQGGMATVYRALDRETNEWCAVKVLHEKYVGKGRIRKRFVVEANAMMRLKHRNVVHVMDLNDKVLQPYFTMELAEGGCIVDWLASYGAMPPKMAVDVSIQVCKGLGAAHRQGVIHRDVKPHNILVNRRGVCKVTDFGIAQLDDSQNSLTRTGSVMGTLGYIAPEQRTNAKDVDERSDVYSVGATLYTMLTARTTMDLFFADQEPEMMKGVHPVLQPIIMKATRYRREDRHQSMRDLAKELYHAKSQLEEDPPDTPALIMNDVSEFDDELDRLTTSEVTAETPFSDVNPALPPPGETVVPSLGNADWQGPSTTPGIPRGSLLRDEQPMSLQGGNAAYLFRAVALGLIPVVVLALLLAGVAMRGRSQVNKHVDRVTGQHDLLAQTLVAEKDIVSELATLGAPELDVNSKWSAWQSVTGATREAKVNEMILSFRKALKEHEPAPGTTQVRIARTATARLDRMDQALGQTRAASRELADTADTVPGRLAIGFGLASDHY